MIAVSTTSGTGSQLTQVAVITKTDERCKSAIYNDIILPRVAAVDPELMLSVPPRMTAFTGFDARPTPSRASFIRTATLSST